MWGRLITGVCIVMAGLALQLAMVIGAVTPNLALALAGYASLFIGMLVAIAGILRLFRSDSTGITTALDNTSRPESQARRSRHRN